MTQETKSEHDIPLSDVMLAMDVADTIRHRDKLVERELSEHEREQALFDKVKKTYASQGIEVSDATIREAIQAVEDERFAYKAVKPSLFTRFAHIYINRAKWAKGFTALAVIAAIAWSISWALFTLPKQRELTEQANKLNQTIVSANQSEKSLQLRLDNLVNELNQAEEPNEQELKALFNRQKQQSFTQLKSAATYIDNARPLKQKGSFDNGNYEELSITALSQVSEQNKQLSQAKQQLDLAETSIKHLHQLKLLPNELLNLRNEALGIAKSTKANTQANQYYQMGLASIKGLDFSAANNATSDLKDLIETLQKDYELRVVSRAGERTGLWRVPDVNSSARNYYIAVEAFDKYNKKLSLPIINEENGQVERVNKWALRVDRSIYDQIARDKQDDGIIQNNVFGNKSAGKLTVQYRFKTTGSAITDW